LILLRSRVGFFSKLTIVAAIGLACSLYACDQTGQPPTAPSTVEPGAASQAATAAPLAAKLRICHLDLLGRYNLIEISTSSEATHRAHGNALPGQSVPGKPGVTFGANCQLIPAPAVCGDGNKAGSEACDDGNTITETSCPYGTATCTACNASCTTILSLTGGGCGDNTVQQGETCDDGNNITETSCPYGTATCTACNATCEATLSLTGSACGDGTLDAQHGETCDDGNNTTETECAYGLGSCQVCNATCQATLSLTGPACGDGTLDAQHGEMCDGGNNTPGDGCSATCISEP
jgi:cysteine-rich repeat protein